LGVLQSDPELQSSYSLLLLLLFLLLLLLLLLLLVLLLVPPCCSADETINCPLLCCCSISLPSPDIIKQFGRSIHHYLGIPSWPVFASNRDPTMTEYFSAKPSNNTAVSATLYTGGTQVCTHRKDLLNRSTIQQQQQQQRKCSCSNVCY
jgi:hypothetical protein